MSERGDFPFYACRDCEWPELCADKGDCIAQRAADRIRAETPPQYPCKQGDGRLSVEPHALRLCAQCLEHARTDYGQQKPDFLREWESRLTITDMRHMNREDMH